MAGQIRALHVGHIWNMGSDLERSSAGLVLVATEAFLRAIPLPPGLAVRYGETLLGGDRGRPSFRGKRKLWMKP